jgi:hypothetical protein
MFKKTTPKSAGPINMTNFMFPHCDQRILHAPGECENCDHHSEWQALRAHWGIAFTGYEPEGTELPCPADHARGDNHKKWGGNVARPNIAHNHLGGTNISGCPACSDSDIAKPEVVYAKTEMMKALPLILKLINNPVFVARVLENGYTFDTEAIFEAFEDAANGK